MLNTTVPQLSSLNLDLLFLDNKFYLPLDSLPTLIQQLQLEPSIKPVVVEEEPIEQVVEEKLPAPAPALSTITAPHTNILKTDNSSIIIQDTRPLEEMSPAVQSKAKILNNNDQITVANNMLRNLLENSSSILWYKTYTYYGIALKRYNTLICYYTPEPRRSKFLTVYVRESLVKKYLHSEYNRSKHSHVTTLILPDLDKFEINRITTTNHCAIYTHNSKRFFQLVKALVKTFGEKKTI